MTQWQEISPFLLNVQTSFARRTNRVVVWSPRCCASFPPCWIQKAPFDPTCYVETCISFRPCFLSTMTTPNLGTAQPPYGLVGGTVRAALFLCLLLFHRLPNGSLAGYCSHGWSSGFD